MRRRFPFPDQTWGWPSGGRVFGRKGRGWMNDEESPERGKRQDPGDAGGELAALIALLKGKGATTVRVVSADRIVVDERVRLKCRVPICDSYDRNLMCPPFVMSVAEFRQTLDRYEEALILQVEAEIAGLNGLRPHEDVYAPAGRLHELVNLAEKEAFMAEAAKNGYVLFFEHDLYRECCTVELTEKGVKLKESFALETV